ncbi:MAG: protein-methionine-sulfoxide reductase catalytic subunit MsrP [Sphingomonadales bacterium]|jgi:sulfoxide reductase catalytic subunit YedY
MLVKNKKTWEISENKATGQGFYKNRREILKSMGSTVGVGLIGASGLLPKSVEAHDLVYKDGGFGTPEEKTPLEVVTSYNNFYEFGTGKDDPARFANSLITDPWKIKIGGHCETKGTFGIEDFIKPHELQERVYRMRCVEAWSMVIPWIGIPLAEIVKKLKPTSDAKYVKFETALRRSEMRGVRKPVLDWPYTEALTLEEALNPLPILAVGLYGESLLNQNGAPIRLVVPWKYGFKGIKSIVSIKFVGRQPMTTWKDSAPREYGFYSNVNPNVDHPRWSQASERRIGEFRRRDTLMYNGYGEEVAHLYDGLDLGLNY